MSTTSARDDLPTRKAALRKAVLREREDLGEEARRKRSEAMTRALLDSEEYRRAGVVLAYSGFGSEVDTLPLLRSVLEDGKALVLPGVDRGERRLRLNRTEDLEEDLRAGTWGILEPLATLPEVGLQEIDLVVAPGVAFDAAGGRLGYGGGFYDRLLAGPGRGPGSLALVALAFEAQVVERVPVGPDDVRVGAVITEDRFVRIS